MNYETATVQELRDALSDGTATAMSLLEEARRVIKERDGEVRAFVEVFDSADEDAKRADAMITAGKHSPLTGIPVAVKDNICVSGQSATAGSKMLEGFVAPYDASVIARLREQGAVLVGRTNMDEFAMGSSTEHSVYGTTYNPRGSAAETGSNEKRVAGGSSGGSAAAVAMGAVPLALGSDTGGSIRQPASFCGVVGLKPTYGSVSRNGLIALGSSLDVIGPFARCTDDAALLFEAIAGDDTGYDNTLALFADEQSGDAPEKTIGVPDNLSSIGISDNALAAFERTVEGMKTAGYTVRSVSLPLMEKAGAMYYILQPAEASSNLARFDGVRYGLHEDGADVWGDYVRSRTAGFGAETTRRIVLGTYVLSAGYYDAYYRKAVGARNALRTAFLEALREVSVIMLPTAPTVAFAEGAIQDPVEMYAQDRLTLQANLTGLPAISVPMRTDGLPLGVQIISGYHQEADVFAVARAVETSGH